MIQTRTPAPATAPSTSPDPNDSNDSLDELLQQIVQRQQMLQQKISELQEALAPHEHLLHRESHENAPTVAELVAAARLAALVERSFASAYAAIYESARVTAAAAEHALAAESARTVERGRVSDSFEATGSNAQSTMTAMEQKEMDDGDVSLPK